MIEAVRRTVSFSSVGREVANGRVVMSLALPGFFLHYPHGHPITVGFSSTKLTRLTHRHRLHVPPDDNAIFPDVNDRHFNAQ